MLIQHERDIEVVDVADRARPTVPSTGWRPAYVGAAATADATAAVIGLAVASLALSPGWWSMSATLAGAGLLATWLLSIALAHGYDIRHLGSGSTEYQLVLRSVARFVVVVAIGQLAVGFSVDREFFAILSVVLAVGSVLGRWLIRRPLHRSRRHGESSSRVLAVGTASSVDALAEHVGRSRWVGLQIVGACCPERGRIPNGLERAGRTDALLSEMDRVGADTIVFTSPPAEVGVDLRQLAWDLEGSGIGLIVAPAVADLAGPRVSVRPVDGLPLVHIDEPRLSRFQGVLKSVVDRVLAAAALLIVAPLLLVIATTIRLTSKGPVLFRQTRIGRHGAPFEMVKFRSMIDDAENQLEDIIDLNDADGPLFKIRNDPRVTPIGRLLRKHSMDELPQLWHVVTGTMALVGPRPPLPSEVAQYDGVARRRLIAKPGLTGLWQVSGRSDLSFEDGIRLDLHYVENWSPALDLAILAKTIRVVVGSQGAY